MNRHDESDSARYQSAAMGEARLKWAIPSLAISVLALQTVFYPQVATWLFRVFSGRGGWDGSALPYVQVFYALPVAISLLGAVLIGARLLARRRPALLKAFLLGAVAVDLLLLGLSVAWYASQVRM